jgi:hypothetical protein
MNINVSKYPDDSIIYRYILSQLIDFLCDIEPSESSIHIIIMYDLELTPKSYELISPIAYAKIL